MSQQSIDKLKSEFGEWRSIKQYRSEQIPDSLLIRARQFIPEMGVTGVARILGIDPSLLSGTQKVRQKSTKSGSVAVAPKFSRIEITQFPQRGCLAEVEVPNGAKLKLFAITAETLNLVATFSGRALL